MTDQLTLFAAATYDPPPETLPDQAARDRIHTDLDTSLLVEAGAGAGKTTEMVRRMVALVRSGRAEVHQVAAVTFTRKAAAELRERFQTELETELRDGALDAATAERLDRALRDIDRAFLGTIHAFCARLLRERPLEAGLDPAFRETMGAEETRLRRRFWHGWLERLSAEGDADLGVLRHAGLAPHQVAALYDELVEQPDVEYPALARPRPDPTAVRAQLEALLDRAAALERHARRDADGLHRTVRTLAFRRAMGWDDDASFMDLLGAFTDASFELKKSRWREPEAARTVADGFVALWSPGGDASELLRDWWAHRYPIALDFARRAAHAYEEERLRAGTLNFHDLLTFAARLLRNSASARRELSDRYRFLLVDEFQDTDPLQAEVLFLLASDEELDLFGEAGVAAWLHLTPRPGALFVVGDPKQSIYRFRRADMTLYQQVRKRFEQWEHGPGSNAAVVELTTNFRSRPPIERFVNDVFSRRFGEASTDEQARFAPMRVRPKAAPVCEGVFRYEHADPHAYVDQIVTADANALASWIHARVESGERQWSDFLVLTPNTTRLSDYATALEARNAPVQVSGAGVAGPRAVELSELRLLLSALCDPGDSTLIVAVLTGLLFGIDFEQLVQHVEKWGGTRAPFAITGPWDDAATPVEQTLARLHGFWQLARREPGDVVVSQVVRELGLLPFAAAGELGGSRAGALLFALDTVRAAAAAGDASLGGALAALEAALVDNDAEAPLEPGDRNAVRVMNLHKAKGLEANVVVLAMPVKGGAWPPKRRVVRDTSGRARGYLVVTDAADEYRTLARPRDWEEHAAIEERFQAAEEDRLLYVAATRAAEELVVGCAYNMRSPSRWRSFHDWLSLNAVKLDMPQTDVPARAQLAESA
ncbi:MAG TPA: UvrD-helicase domain-containing protein, partial [Longimicrobiales bacterium]|nr:UvrD-helicase domain-containing protein [Longimicrobiales bacterium]